MSVLPKLFVVLLALCCFMHFVEMSRIPRDATETQFEETLGKINEKIKEFKDNPSVKNFAADAEKSLGEIAEQMKALANSVLETMTKNAEALKAKE